MVLNKLENIIVDLNIVEKQKNANESNFLKYCLPLHSQFRK